MHQYEGLAPEDRGQGQATHGLAVAAREGQGAPPVRGLLEGVVGSLDGDVLPELAFEGAGEPHVGVPPHAIGDAEVWSAAPPAHVVGGIALGEGEAALVADAVVVGFGRRCRAPPLGLVGLNLCEAACLCVVVKPSCPELVGCVKHVLVLEERHGDLGCLINDGDLRKNGLLLGARAWVGSCPPLCTTGPRGPKGWWGIGGMRRSSEPRFARKKPCDCTCSSGFCRSPSL